MLKRLLAGVTALALSLGMVALTTGPVAATSDDCHTFDRTELTWDWNSQVVVSYQGVTLTKPAGGHNNIAVSGTTPSSITISSNGGTQDRTGQTVLNGDSGSDIQWVTVCVTAGSPATDPTPYVLVAWSMPSWVDSTTPTWSQAFFAKADLSTKDLNALDGQLTACGTQYQVDLYDDSATTSALIAGGVLNGPSNPPEDFPSPSGWGVTYKLIHNPDCAEPEDVSGSVNSDDETCSVDYSLERGWVEPVATEGVAYELYASDQTTVVAAPFTAKVEVDAGTYWVKVISTDTSKYTVTEEWIEVTVGEYDGDCTDYVKVVGDPFDFQQCVADGGADLTSTWVATLTIDTADTEPIGSVQYRVFVWDGSDWVDQGIWPEGVYTAGPGGDFPYTQVKVTAEAVSPYVIKDGTQTEWMFDFSDPLDCNLPDFGIVEPVVTFSATCSASPTYTLAITGGVQGTVLWSVNGGAPTTQLGTFPAPATTVTVVATPAPGSGFDGNGLPRTFTMTFGSAEACGDLTTLAFTGDDLSGALAVTALLGLLGTVLIRAGRRRGRDAVQG